ncbi:hypothetical protein K3495_g8749 [Podosphaera aphanis]|nr:hypothetical protein K3495_g8749 [Podosphaera aphanis]
MRSGNPLSRFSYADDIGILGFGPTIAELAAAAQRESEVVKFPGQRLESAVDINVNGTPIQLAEHIRWLGVFLDPRLNFKHHVTTWCAKVMNVAHHMRRLNPNFRGAALGQLVKTVDSCIVPVASYRADVWWPGIKRPTQRGIVTSSTTSLCYMIDKAILTGLRAALPTLRTVSNRDINPLPQTPFSQNTGLTALAAPRKKRPPFNPELGAIRQSNRERKQADPGPGMIPNTQRYQAHAVAVEPISYQQAIQANESDLWKSSLFLRIVTW